MRHRPVSIPLYTPMYTKLGDPPPDITYYNELIIEPYDEHHVGISIGTDSKQYKVRIQLLEEVLQMMKLTAKWHYP